MKRSQFTNSRVGAALRTLLPALALLFVGAEATANTLTQNVSWTIDRVRGRFHRRGLAPRARFNAAAPSAIPSPQAR